MGYFAERRRILWPGISLGRCARGNTHWYTSSSFTRTTMTMYRVELQRSFQCGAGHFSLLPSRSQLTLRLWAQPARYDDYAEKIQQNHRIRALPGQFLQLHSSSPVFLSVDPFGFLRVLTRLHQNKHCGKTIWLATAVCRLEGQERPRNEYLTIKAPSFHWSLLAFQNVYVADSTNPRLFVSDWSIRCKVASLCISSF